MTSKRPEDLPEKYHSIMPYLAIKDARRAIEFYQKALGARVHDRIDTPEGQVMHAELEIGDSILMLTEEMPEMGAKSASTLGGTPIGLMVYVDNVDEVAKMAKDTGMKELRPVENQFYGDRMGTFEDPFGFVWHISTPVEQISSEEMKRRAQKMWSERKSA